MSSKYHPLLPAPERSQDRDIGLSSQILFAEGLTKRKRVGVQIACEECRRRKVRCNGEQPRCEACQKRGEKEGCNYEQRGSDKAEHKLLELLKTLPRSESNHVLQLLRLHDEPVTVLRMVREGEGLGRYRPEEEGTEACARHSELELELMAENPVAFPPLQNAEPNIARDLASLDVGNLPNLVANSPSSDLHATDDLPPIPILCDLRLADLNMGLWTSVPISNDLASRIISLYLSTDHPLLGTFDPDLFVRDLIGGGSYCTQMLVSAVMYWGCQMYTSLDPEASQFIYRFKEEAEKPWQYKQPDSLLNLAVLQLLSMANLGHGKDHHVLDYVWQANAMGTRMGLFGLDPDAAASSTRDTENEGQKAASYAAWGSFNWIVLISLFYQQPGVPYPAYPPCIPVPGCARHDSNDGNATSVRGSIQPSYMGETFPALCQFWTMIHEVTLRYYRDNPPPRGQLRSVIDLPFAEYKYRELIAWTDTLPTSLVRSKNSPHHVIILHMWLHAAIFDIFRPFTSGTWLSMKSMRLRTFSARRSCVNAAYEASVNQLKSLVVAYRLEYRSSAYTMLWHTALIYLGNVMVHSQDPAWRSYLLLCIYCYRSLRRSYRFAETAGRGLLSMAMRSGHLSAGKARRIMQQVKEKGLDHAADDIRATFMMDLNLAITNPEQASAEALAGEFEDMAMFQEYTNQNGLMNEEP